MAREPLFPQSYIDQWYEALETRKPNRPTELELEATPRVDAFNAGVLTVGAAIRLRDREGRDADFLLNPVVARELAHWLLFAGHEAGWLDAEGKVIIPLGSRLDG